MRFVAIGALLLPACGCAAFGPTATAPIPRAPNTAFQLVQRFRCGPLAQDFGPGSLAEFKATLCPGDLVAVYLDPHRAILKGQPQYLFLPCGHALVALHGGDAPEFLECMAGGANRVRADVLRRFSQVDVYRLADATMLDLGRLHQFADEAMARSRSYDFRTWVGCNASMRPNRPEEIAPGYSCAGIVAAAYHYAGATLDASAPGWGVVTPQHLIRSVAAPAGSAGPAP